MSNLGLYQTMVTLAKRVGGPIPLALEIGVCGYISGKAIELIIESRKNAKDNRLRGVFVAKTYCCSSSDYELDKGDQIKILQDIGDIVLVEIVGRHDNPHVMSKEELYNIADKVDL